MNFGIIAVDDQPNNLLVLKEYLGSEFQVTSLSTKQKLIDHITNGGRADLILLDIVMPMPDGYIFCIWLKSNPATRDIPVIFMASLESQINEAYALSLGDETLSTSLYPHRLSVPEFVIIYFSVRRGIRYATRTLILKIWWPSAHEKFRFKRMNWPTAQSS